MLTVLSLLEVLSVIVKLIVVPVSRLFYGREGRYAPKTPVGLSPATNRETWGEVPPPSTVLHSGVAGYWDDDEGDRHQAP